MHSIDAIERELRHSIDTDKDIINLSSHFLHAYSLDLASPPRYKHTMCPTYVDRLPTGKESGKFLAMDLGGTNFRVGIVQLSPGGIISVLKLSSWKVTDDLKKGIRVQNGESEDWFLFDWMASRVADVIRDEEHIGTWSLGAAFSFQIDHTAIDAATIMKMGKGFTLSNVEGSDFHDLVECAFRKKNLPVQLTAILNDGVATLLSAAFKDPTTRIAIILGTGTNATCPVATSRLALETDSKFMLLNTEWSFYGEDFLPTTEADRILDSHVKSFKPWSQPYEQRMSGMYLGELLRLHAIQAGIFESIPLGWETEWSVKAEYMAALEMDLKRGKEILMKVFKFDQEPTDYQLMSLSRISSALSSRSAILLAAGLVAMIDLADQVDNDTQHEQHLTIAINGSVVERYPQYQKRLRIAMRKAWGVPPDDDSDIVVNPRGLQVRLQVADEGGILGAAIGACLYAR